MFLKYLLQPLNGNFFIRKMSNKTMPKNFHTCKYEYLQNKMNSEVGMLEKEIQWNYKLYKSHTYLHICKIK